MNVLPSQTAGIQSSERILTLDLEIIGIKQPERPKSLPKVMSICKWRKILTASNNIKHPVKPNFWLFEGQTKGKSYSAKSLSMVFKKAQEKAGLTQNYTLHSLRYSFATHLYEQGGDILKIQRQLGHADLKTTLIYTHLSNQASSQITSPLDRLQIPRKGHKKE